MSAMYCYQLFADPRYVRLIAFCLSASISKNYVQILTNFLYMLPVAVDRSSSDDNAIRYVLSVLWMTSCFTCSKWIGIKDGALFRPVRQMAAPGVKPAVSECILFASQR